MKCEEEIFSMSLYLDKELNKEEEADFLMHLKECEECRKLFEEIKLVYNSVNRVPLEELPKGYGDELFDKIKSVTPAEQEVPMDKTKKKGPWKKYTLLAASVLVLIAAGSVIASILPGVGSKSSSPSESFSARSNQKFEYDTGSSYDEQFNGSFSLTSDSSPAAGAVEGTYPEEAPSYKMQTETDTMDLLAGSEQFSERLKIKRLYVSIQTREYDAAITAFKSFAESNGGYVQNYYSNNYYYDSVSGVSLREGNITLRIPKESFDESKSLIKEYGEVLNEDENTEDITSEYVDTEGRLRMKRLEEDRLLKLLEKSENIEDIIKIEERLGYIRSDIESYTSLIKNWDRLVEFSTVTISVTELSEAKISTLAPDFSTRMKDSFIESINNFSSDIQNLLISIAGNLIYVIIFIIAAVFIFLIVRNRKKKKKGAKN